MVGWWRRVLVLVAGGHGVVAGGQESGEAMLRAGHIRCGRRDTRQGICLGVAFWRVPHFLPVPLRASLVGRGLVCIGTVLH